MNAFHAVSEFIVGDDWRPALGAVVGVAAAAAITAAGLPGWWALPAIVVMALWWSAGRVTARQDG